MGLPLVNHAIDLVASSVEELHFMFDMVTDRLYKGNLRWKASEVIFTTGSNEPDVASRTVSLPDGGEALVMWKPEIEVLGALLDQRGSPHASISHKAV